MKLITFLACIMMGLSIWSVTVHAQENPQPAVNPKSADSFAKAADCPVCSKNVTDSKGCQSGFNASDCEKLFDGKKGDEQKVNPNDVVK